MADITAADLRKSQAQCEIAAEIVTNKGVQRLLRSAAYRFGSVASQMALRERDDTRARDEASALKDRIAELERANKYLTSTNKLLHADLDEAQLELARIKVSALPPLPPVGVEVK